MLQVLFCFLFFFWMDVSFVFLYSGRGIGIKSRFVFWVCSAFYPFFNVSKVFFLGRMIFSSGRFFCGALMGLYRVCDKLI